METENIDKYEPTRPRPSLNGFCNAAFDKNGEIALASSNDTKVPTHVSAPQDNTTTVSMGKKSLFRDRNKLIVSLCILLTEMLERLTFYSVSANMVLFCTSRLGFSTVDATSFGLIFNALSNLFPVLGGYVSDSWIGRFYTILGAGFINLVGLLLIQASAIEFDMWFDYDMNEEGKRSCYLTGAILLTLGTGGIKANISPFGAEQLESLGKETVQSFFNWFYWVINIGALLAYSGVAYLQQNIDFTWGLFIPLAATVLEIMIFFIPRALYIRTAPQGSVISTAVKIMRQGCCKKPPTNSGKHEKMLTAAKKSQGGSYDDITVDGLVDVIAVMPFCLLVIMYYAIYSQTTSSFFVQSERMDVRLESAKFPAAMLNSIGNISIIILIPVIDRLFYPCMKKIGLPLTHLKRIAIGMVLSVIAVVVAGVVEIYRKEYLFAPGGSHVQELAGENFTASSMSVFVQVPQFSLIGASEIFTSVTCLEFAYSQAPVSLQGLLTGLFLAAWGLGNLLSMGIMLVVEQATQGDPWFGDEINNIKMENLMFLLAGLMGINFISFCVVAHFFKYRTNQIPDSQPDQIDVEINVKGTGVDSKDQNVPAKPSDNNALQSYFSDYKYDDITDSSLKCVSVGNDTIVSRNDKPEEEEEKRKHNHPENGICLKTRF